MMDWSNLHTDTESTTSILMLKSFKHINMKQSSAYPVPTIAVLLKTHTFIGAEHINGGCSFVLPLSGGQVDELQYSFTKILRVTSDKINGTKLGQRKK